MNTIKAIELSDKLKRGDLIYINNKWFVLTDNKITESEIELTNIQHLLKNQLITKVFLLSDISMNEYNYGSVMGGLFLFSMSKDDTFIKPAIMEIKY